MKKETADEIAIYFAKELLINNSNSFLHADKPEELVRNITTFIKLFSEKMQSDIEDVDYPHWLDSKRRMWTSKKWADNLGDEIFKDSDSSFGSFFGSGQQSQTPDKD